MARWEGVFEFVQVVDTGSFSGAAARMGISNSQVSKMVARLEDRLGTRLLNRTTRRLTLTNEGEHFYHRCRQTIEAFESAENDIASHQHEPRGNLKVSIAGSLPENFVVPILTDFLEKHPLISVEIDFSDGRVDLISRGYDLAIWQGELKDSSLIARKLTENIDYLVAHPDYLARHGEPREPEHLKQLHCLANHNTVWQLRNGSDTFLHTPKSKLHSNSASARLTAARRGLGIAQLSAFAVLDDLQQKTLVQVLKNWSLGEQKVWIVYPQNKHVSAKVRLFIDYLVTRMSALPL